MWNRSELKSNAKLALKANYWKAVLVGLILSFILGSGSTAAQNSARSSTDGLTDIDPVMVFTVIGIILAAVFVAMVISISSAISVSRIRDSAAWVKELVPAAKNYADACSVFLSGIRLKWDVRNFSLTVSMVTRN